MEVKTIYVANDGKEFDNEFDCQSYEWETVCDDGLFFGCRFYNEEKEEIFPKIGSTAWVENAAYIFAPTEKAKNAIDTYCDSIGSVCPFESIDGKVAYWSDRDCSYIDYEEEAERMIAEYQEFMARITSC